MAVRDIELPNYRLSHELWNSISHGLTGIFGIMCDLWFCNYCLHDYFLYISCSCKK